MIQFNNYVKYVSILNGMRARAVSRNGYDHHDEVDLLYMHVQVCCSASATTNQRKLSLSRIL